MIPIEEKEKFGAYSKKFFGKWLSNAVNSFTVTADKVNSYKSY